MTMFIACPPLVGYFIFACDAYKCAVIQPAVELFQIGLGPLQTWWQTEFVAKISWIPVAIVLGWILFQAVLDLCVPCPVVDGDRTPDGRRLKYRVGALRAYVITVAVYLGGSFYFGRPWASAFFYYRVPIFVLVNLYGFALALGLVVFAHVQGEKKHADRVFSGSFAYDMLMGVDLHPRIGNMFDLKLFHNGRVGMIAWPIVVLTYMMEMYHEYHTITPAMWVTVFLQLMYCIDFFYAEEWYLKTIDVALDHFGWYLCWGITVWLPFTYTLQARYLLANPALESQSWTYALVCLAIGMVGFSAFRLVNTQRNEFRKLDGQCTIYGRVAEYLEAPYVTGDGVRRVSKLLLTGPWGWARHFNYSGDLLLSLAYGLPAGFHDLMPYYFFVFMTILLVHRVARDDLKCRTKYGAKWNEYCQRVPYKIFPGLY
jgi:7-dehydrocholesterol reductase